MLCVGTVRCENCNRQRHRGSRVCASWTPMPRRARAYANLSAAPFSSVCAPTVGRNTSLRACQSGRASFKKLQKATARLSSLTRCLASINRPLDQIDRRPVTRETQPSLHGRGAGAEWGVTMRSRINRDKGSPSPSSAFGLRRSRRGRGPGDRGRRERGRGIYQMIGSGRGVVGRLKQLTTPPAPPHTTHSRGREEETLNEA